MGKKDVGVAVVKELAKDVYKDGFQPATKQVGEALNTLTGLANTVLLPVKLANAYFGYKASEFLTDLENKAKDIPADKLQEPPLMIAGPVLEGLKYNDNQDLREMFLNLLAASMNSDTADNAHPSYVETIKQLSPLDAKIFREIYLVNQFACAKLELKIRNQDQVFRYAFPTYFVNELYQFADPFLVSSTLQNIIRLGLINHFSDKGILGYDYEKIRTNKYVKDRIELFNQSRRDTELFINIGVIIVNNYGDNFAKICLSS